MTKATRIAPDGKESGLDHVYSNKPEKCSEVAVLTNGASDHKMLKFTRFTKAKIRTPKFIRKRSYKHFNQKAFLEEIAKETWLPVYLSNDPDEATEIFTEKLTKVLDKHAPMKTFQIRKNYAPWLSEESKLLIKK